MAMWNFCAWLLASVLSTGDPLQLLGMAPGVSASERRTLDRGETVFRTLDGPTGGVGLLAVQRINANGATLIARVRSIEELRRSRFVTAIQRFSDPPRLEDLDALMLAPRELDALARCRAGACAFKLTASEIAIVSRAARSPVGDRDEELQRAFRVAVLRRVEAYLAGGLTALPPVLDRRAPLRLGAVFDGLVTASAPLPGGAAAAHWLREAAPRSLESFVYWSHETYGAGKPVVIVTHVALLPPRADGDPAIVLGKQIFASHYMNGAVALSAIVSEPDGSRYLVYSNHTAVDLLGGPFGPLKRAVLESRLRSHVPELVGSLRKRLERTDRDPLR